MKLLLATLPFGLLALFHAPILPVAKPNPATRALPPDSTTVRLLYGAESADLTELMGRVLHVEKHRLELRDRRLAGRHLHLTLQEYRYGVPGPEKLLDSDVSLTQLDSAGRLAITIYARQASKNKVENTFILPRAAMPRTFTAVPGQADKYSLRFDIHPLRRSPDQTGTAPNSPATEFKLPIGPAAVLAVYTLPYEKDGFSYYCNLAQSRVPVAEWYSRFKVPHFIVYRARVE
ncbi:hypothetical protein [Hymenobacter psoromatis]|uniref:hypothetical protein n=1 Tax=Hymenobacter psoromatis TaxID=1484116 RepID=UPI001CC00467|nr:hypothetical protein [Hymenobacter psoromatis]